MVKVGIVGISGYSGLTLLELLLKHPLVRIGYVGANTTQGKVTAIWPQLEGRTNLVCRKFNAQKAARQCDVIFLAVPHAVSMAITPQLLKNHLRIVDLSGDYRLKNTKDYKKWYGVEHRDAANLAKAVYGLPEFYREDIKKARLVANPGCYPTAALLALAPFVATQPERVESIMIDAKSGVTGAGRKVNVQSIFPEINENFKAYKVLQHQHTPEINLYLTKMAQKPVAVHFVPHLLPINRGILETIYVQLKRTATLSQIHNLYKRFYKTEPFMRILEAGGQPEIKNVVGTNYCDIGLAVSDDHRLLVVTSAIDNVVKGAAGQAIQNMNLMYGFKETEGLL